MSSPQATELARQALKAYVEHFGGIHEDTCPFDDTCDCSGKAINDGVTLAVNLLDHVESLTKALDAYEGVTADITSERDEARGNAAAAQLEARFYEDAAAAQKARAEKAELRIESLEQALRDLLEMYGPSTDYDYKARENWQRAEEALKVGTP